MIYHVYATKSNIGDWLSAKAIQSLLRPARVQELFCDSPYTKETLQVLDGLTPDNFIIIGGGGLLMDYFDNFWEGFQRKIAHRLPYVLWGVGCCNSKNEDTEVQKDLIIDVIRQSQLCIVRDQLTWDFLRNCHLLDPVPCPSTSIIEMEDLAGCGILNVSHAGLVSAADRDKIAYILNKAAKRKGSTYMECRNRIDPPNNNTLKLELEKYRVSNIVVSSRLHGCIIAASMGKKLIAISGDKKIDDFMHAAGLDDWLIETHGLDKLPEMMDTLYLQKPPMEFLRHAHQSNLEISEKIKKLIRLSADYEYK